MIMLPSLFPPWEVLDRSCVTGSPTPTECTQAAGPPSRPSHTRQPHNKPVQFGPELISLLQWRGLIHYTSVKAGMESICIEELASLILNQLHLSSLSPAMGTRAGRGWEANVPAEGGDTPIHSLFWTWYCSIASTTLDVVKEYHPSLVY